METTSGDYHTEKRVGGGLVAIANEVDPPIAGSPSIEGSPKHSVEVVERLEEEDDLADANCEDGINPDDAPEVVLGDIDEEVCIKSARFPEVV
jgi:hypothetical protein